MTAHSFARTAGPGALPHNSYSQCQTAQSSSFPRRVAAPGFCLSLFHPPHEGRAERRKAQYFCCRAFRRATIRACRGAARVQRDALASRRSTVAIFGRGPRFLLRHFLRISAASSSQPGRNAWRAGSRTSRGLGYEPRPQDATPRSAFGSSPETAPQNERGYLAFTPSAHSSQHRIDHVVVISECIHIYARGAGSAARPLHQSAPDPGTSAKPGAQCSGTVAGLDGSDT